MQIKPKGGRPREDKAPAGHLTTRQAADYLNCSTQAIRNGIRDRRLPGKIVPREGTKEVRYYVLESALMDMVKADEAAMSGRDVALAAKDETIAELRQRVAFQEHHIETLEALEHHRNMLETLELRIDTLETLLPAALKRTDEQPAALDENKDVSWDKTNAPRGKQVYLVDGTKLRKLRARRAMTLWELVKLAALSYNRLSDLENGGQRVNPSTLKKLAAVFEVSPHDLILEEPEEEM
jgi:DNA-binding Xre family transcriptional regulator